ncbi:MAG: ABC transporter permease [Bacteroidetes bacterium]|nr:ABC transporter permease [Bacteroidota bacterium]
MNLLEIKIFFRDIKNSKEFSVIAIAGLAVGMTVTILLFTYVRHELSFDQFHEKSKRIYRLNSVISDNITTKCIGLKDSILQQNVPEIEEVLQFYDISSFQNTKLVKDGVQIKNVNLIYSTPNILKVFTLKFLRGTPSNVLLNPKTIVLTESLAKKIFNNIDVIGEAIITNHAKDIFTITGVIKDYPSASHLKIDAIVPIQSTPFNVFNGGAELYTYILFKEGLNNNRSITKVKDCYNQIFSVQMKKRGIDLTDCFLQKLTDIHLRSGFKSKDGYDAAQKKILIYLSLALVVLLIAIINYINLFTAQYEGKQKEMSLLKVIGASRRHIVFLFLIKSLTLSFLAILIAGVLVELLLPSVEYILNRDLTPTHHNFRSLFYELFLITIIVGITGGIYPALKISKVTGHNVLKKDFFESKRKKSFTMILVTIQFVVMIFLISCVFVMVRQITFMKNRDLGFSSKAVIAITGLDTKIGLSYRPIKESLLKIPEIKSVGASYQLFGTMASRRNIKIGSEGLLKDFPIREYRVFPGFLETLDFEFLYGRPFNENIITDKDAIVINETALREFGILDPLGFEVSLSNKLKVVGVVKDFHFSSLEKEIEPLMFTNYNKSLKNIIINISNNEIENVIPKVEAVIRGFDPEYIMDYVFLDDIFRERYRSQEQMETLFGYSSILCLIIAMFGLYALSSVIIQKKRKEIGIRKVNGAKISEILIMLNKDILKWVAISFFIAAPLAFYVMHNWLQNFAYKTQLDWWVFALSGMIALGIAIITVTWRSWNEALRNPVEALKHE